MFDYTTHAKRPEEGVTVTVQLHPLHHGATHHQPLALALLPVLDTMNLRAHVQNGRHRVSQVALSFHDPLEHDAPYIFCRFVLSDMDAEEIQRIAKQAQRYLEDAMTEAVDIFNTVLAVGSIEPWQTRLRHLHEAMAASREDSTGAR